jgi:hypothetical protein
MAQYDSFVVAYAKPGYSPTLSSVWRVAPDELAPIAARNLETLEMHDLRKLHKQLSWAHHAIQEFQDLQFIMLGAGPYPNNSRYVFYEGLTVLREAAVSGLNNLFHASLGLMRTTLELFLFDAWWKSRLNSEADWKKFDAWTTGSWDAPPFKNVMGAVYKDLRQPPTALGEEQAALIYQNLCSYSHKSLPRESLTRLRGTNLPKQSPSVLQMWAHTLFFVSNIVLDLLIASTRCVSSRFACTESLDLIPRLVFSSTRLTSFRFGGPWKRASPDISISIDLSKKWSTC